MSRARRTGKLVAVEGVDHPAISTAARETIEGLSRRERGGISWWGASGVFDELAMAGDDAGAASARTLLLLYAADLAFRLRWEIRPMLAKGRTVVAAPYVETAAAFGRAAGIPAEWVRDLFQFAPRPDATTTAGAVPPAQPGEKGFVEFGCEYLGKPGRHRGAEKIAPRVRRLLRT